MSDLQKYARQIQELEQQEQLEADEAQFGRVLFAIVACLAAAAFCWITS